MVRFSGVRPSATVALIGVLTLLGSLVLMESMAKADNADCGRLAANYAGRTYQGYGTKAPFNVVDSVVRAYPMKVVFGQDGTVTVTLPRNSGLGGEARFGESEGTYTVAAGTVEWTVPTTVEGDLPRTFSSRDRGCDNSVAVPRSIGGVTSDTGEGEIRGVFTLYRQT